MSAAGVDPTHRTYSIAVDGHRATWGPLAPGAYPLCGACGKYAGAPTRIIRAGAQTFTHTECMCLGCTFAKLLHMAAEQAVA